MTAVDPLRGDAQSLLTPDDNLVQIPSVHVDDTAVTHINQLHRRHLPADGRLTIRFLMPTRLEEKGQLFRTPDFGVFFRRLLYRIDELNRQFAGGGRRDPAEVARLNALAEKVRLVEADVRWRELWSHSDRKGSKTPLSGFTGTAVYHADDWSELLPWLIWGQAVQTGKSTAKGNGVFELLGGDWPLYWDWLRLESLADG
ncbi:MAG TPA: CRISPR system precrRNA processing endoribonuclease RAMP protein Cas6 [Anaerolineae bacterium]|nr:CRISPR system precrRNA processing endoribonuclease RAMP protein Cas6 [Anaerolineae bacterium]